MTRQSMIRAAILLSVFLCSNVTAVSAKDTLSGGWRHIKPGMTPEQLLELVPKGALKTQAGGDSTITAHDFEYARKT